MKRRGCSDTSPSTPTAGRESLASQKYLGIALQTAFTQLSTVVSVGIKYGVDTIGRAAAAEHESGLLLFYTSKVKELTILHFQ